MGRIALLLIILIWMAWTPGDSAGLSLSTPLRVGVFLGFYALLIVVLGIWSRVMTAAACRRGTTYTLHRASGIFGRMRMLVLAWFAFGVFVLDWEQIIGPLVDRWLPWPTETPQLIIGTLPAVVAWTLLWWAQYPIERALRERRAMLNLNAAVPAFIPPTLGEYLRNNIRTHVLFTLGPALAIFGIIDVVLLGLRRAGIPPDSPWEGAVSSSAVLLGLLASPIMLARILPSQRLPASPLRARLEAFCRRRRLRFADIRLWHTHGMVANAAVMGILPPVRYLVVSDLIIESMPDDEIEAIFAHEAGHVVHHHLFWLALTLLTYTHGMTMLGTLIMPHLHFLSGIGDLPQGLLSLLIGMPLLWLVFGLVSRQFERQADVFSARIMQQRHDLPSDDLAPPSRRMRDTKVGQEGAAVTADALAHIALLNDIDPASGVWRNWLHGSINSRMRFVHWLSEEPGRTARFDRRLYQLRTIIALLAAGLAAWTVWSMTRP